jgi:serine-type D-Ala-D-Ala carboxypeptidase
MGLARLTPAMLALCSMAAAPRPSRLEYRIKDQDSRFHSAFETVDKWIRDGAFPGATLAVGQQSVVIALKAFGRTQYAPDAPVVTADQIFDLASLTKVIGTTTAVAILYDENKLALDALVSRYLPEFSGTPGHDQITIRQLLTHSSGIPTPGLLYEKAANKAGILKQVYTTPLDSPPGTKFVYRDPNFMLLGEVVERVIGKPIDEFLYARVFGPLGMSSTQYNPSPKLVDRIAPTQKMGRRIVHGQVHDENCYVMGGVCGHAGLFSSAGDLAVYAQMILNGGSYGGKRILKAGTVELFQQRQNLPAGSSRALGWDTPFPGSFAGDLAPTRAIMHTGFTGTSVHIDSERNAFIILLTNRVHPLRENDKIDSARPEIHTEILRAIKAIER